MRRPHPLAILSVLILASGCASGLSREHIEHGTYRQTLRHGEDGRKRAFRLHVPAGYDGSRPLPLLVVIHGAFSSSRQMIELTGFDDLADRESFVVAYPDGIGVLGLLQHWNAGFCCGKAQRDGIDDVGFVAAMIDEVADALRGFDAAEIMWEFLESKRLPDPR